ncbi:unnamed protein product [Thlaspi arvense]|uniref:Uncharacterized protein n=1 Tax=Thlaspi arvense TaxID=13288 RepID=A0AAU9R8I8_THLAR|nr:unnamed protein product [Thlaspi arvense]
MLGIILPFSPRAFVIFSFGPFSFEPELIHKNRLTTVPMAPTAALLWENVRPEQFSWFSKNTEPVVLGISSFFNEEMCQQIDIQSHTYDQFSTR